MVEIESNDTSGNSKSWDALDDKFGRIVAQQVEQNWNFVPGKIESGQKKKPKGNSISQLYLDPTAAAEFYFTGNLTETILPFESCEGDQHLKNLDPAVKKGFLAAGTQKCVDSSNAHISGGTY